MELTVPYPCRGCLKSQKITAKSLRRKEIFINYQRFAPLRLAVKEKNDLLRQPHGYFCGTGYICKILSKVKDFLVLK